MDESTMRGMELLKLNDDGAPSRILPSPVIISVEGYDTSVQEYALELALRKHFSSCGEIKYVYFPRDYVGDYYLVPTEYNRGDIQRVAFMRIIGEDSLDKALELDGTKVGGCNLQVKAAVWPTRWSSPYVPKELEAVRVTGFDTSLPKIDLQMALCDHFYLCGEVINVCVWPSYADVVLLGGKRSVENALKLSGSSMGGMELVVEYLPKPSSSPRRISKGPRTIGIHPWVRLEEKKEEIESEMKKVVDEKKKKKMTMELKKIDRQIRKVKGIKPEQKWKKQILTKVKSLF